VKLEWWKFVKLEWWKVREVGEVCEHDAVSSRGCGTPVSSDRLSVIFLLTCW